MYVLNIRSSGKRGSDMEILDDSVLGTVLRLSSFGQSLVFKLSMAGSGMEEAQGDLQFHDESPMIL
jgi:hypothetical protein